MDTGVAASPGPSLTAWRANRDRLWGEGPAAEGIAALQTG